jgi:hypothetical protein
MFNSSILDVAIGMIFVYLLLSLMCSAANELIELLLKKRGRELERGICELLSEQDTQNFLKRFYIQIKSFLPRMYSWFTGSKTATEGMVADLYNHPLINGLFKGKYEPGSRRLPAYIPATNFALAVMDLVPQHPAPPPPAAPAPATQGALNATAPPPAAPSTTAAYQVVVNLPPAAGGAVPALPAPPVSPPPTNPLSDLRDAVTNLSYERPKKALLPLIDAAGNDASKARQNIEDWYNSSMDRVSGWYKRRSQVIILIIGFLVAIGLNADSVVIAKRLSTDKALRDSVAAAAVEYAKASASPSASPSLSASPAPPSLPAGTATGKTSPTPIPLPNCEKGQEDSAQCKYSKSKAELESLGLPIGWDTPGEQKQGESAEEMKQRKWPGLHFLAPGVLSDWYTQVRLHFLGWLLTALAISLGAPFWFDMLNKLIVVRSTVKPKEKSQDEPSKS